ncbi:hypothetical protein EI94DRAFT_1818941 [Lactarius quietus]|nr:hypothetical protein EI94DRAFT_1818941 [Lactarius quietus]
MRLHILALTLALTQSTCLGSKLVMKRTIEAHLWQDQDFLGSIQSDTISAKIVQSHINQTINLLARINTGHGRPNMTSDLDGSCPEGSEVHTPSEVSKQQGEAREPDGLFSSDMDIDIDPHMDLGPRQPDYHQGDARVPVLDGLFFPTDTNTDIDPYMELGPDSTTVVESDDPTYWGMDPNVSDTELDQLEEISSPVYYDSDDSDTAEFHPVLEAPLEANTDDSDTAELHHVQKAPADDNPSERELASVGFDEDSITTADVPEVIKRLQKELLNGY